MKKILIIGAGAIGGSLACRLGQLDVLVTILERNESICNAINTDGLQLSLCDGAIIKSRVVAVQDIRDTNCDFDYVFSATRAYHLSAAVESIIQYLPDTTLFISMNNGVCLPELLGVVGDLRAVWCSINFGAGITDVGKYRLKIDGGLKMGMLNGYCPPKLSDLCKLVNKVIPCEITDNIEGMLYSKMLINSCITSSALITGQLLGEILSTVEGRTLFDRIIAEGVAVANAEGICIPPYDGKLNYYTLIKTNPFALLEKKIVYTHLAKKYGSRTSATLEALQSGTPTETYFYNGYIYRLGIKHHIPCPVNAEICHLISEIEEDISLISPYNLHLVLDKCKK